MSSFGLWSYWVGMRNRMLRSPRFQRWSARFLFTRRLARRRAQALFDLSAGFVYSQVLHAVVQLRVLDALTDGPRTLAELLPSIALPPDGARRLLDAAAALRLLERRGEHYALGIHGAALLGNRGIWPMIEHHALLYRDLADPIALLRGERPDTELRRFWSYSRSDIPSSSSAGQVAGYSQLMASSLSLLVEDLLEAWPFHRHRHLLDLAGGEGALAQAVATAVPGLSITLFDLPAVAARAAARFDGGGLGDRVRAVGGDLHRDPLPQGADLISLVRVIHDHDDEAALAILQVARRALAPGGTLLVAEPMAGTAGAEAMGDAYFGLYLASMGQGRPRTETELRRLLETAGFRAVSAVPTRRPMIARLLAARN